MHNGTTDLVARLAAAAECDPRTATRALALGVDAIRTATVRRRLSRAMRELALDSTGAVVDAHLLERVRTDVALVDPTREAR